MAATSPSAPAVVSLGWEEFVLVLDRAMCPTADGPVPLEHCRAQRWVLFPPDHGLSKVIATACVHAGFQPREAVRTTQVEAVARFAASGLGPALVPDNIVPLGLDAEVRSVDPPVVRELVRFTRTEWSPSAHEHLALLNELPWRRRPRRALDVTAT